jgi:hypothetical protein
MKIPFPGDEENCGHFRNLAGHPEHEEHDLLIQRLQQQMESELSYGKGDILLRSSGDGTLR